MYFPFFVFCSNLGKGVDSSKVAWQLCALPPPLILAQRPATQEASGHPSATGSTHDGVFRLAQPSLDACRGQSVLLTTNRKRRSSGKINIDIELDLITLNTVIIVFKLHVVSVSYIVRYQSSPHSDDLCLLCIIYLKTRNILTNNIELKFCVSLKSLVVRKRHSLFAFF